MLSPRIILFIIFGLCQQTKMSPRRCELGTEVFSNQWCYRLLRLNESLNCSNTNCFSNKLINLYTFDPKIDTDYEFTTLKPNNQQDVWQRLLSTILVTNQTQIRILINQFKLNETTFVEGVGIDSDHPNLLIHDEYDSSLVDGRNYNYSNEKCILGHQIPSNNESFTFKYTSCSKKLPFICIRDVYQRESFNSDDRCHFYRREYPGGNWIECDKLILSAANFQMRISQKCCLFNMKLKETYWGASSFCSRFNSFVYSFKSNGYKEILENYAVYLNLNYVKSNHSSFWTSCRLVKENIKCESDSVEAPDWKSVSFGHGFFISYLLHKNNRLRLNYINASNWFVSSNESYLEREKTISQLRMDYFLLARRRSNSASKITIFTTGTNGVDRECFVYEPIAENRIYLSLPYLKNCYHFIISNESAEIMKQSNHTFPDSMRPLKTSQYESLYGVLKSLGIIEFSCESDLNGFIFGNGSSDELSNCSSNKHGFGIEVKRFLRLNTNSSKWLAQILDLLMVKKLKLFLYGFTRIFFRLEISCWDRFVDLKELVKICLRFYDDQFCVFKCPVSCEFLERMRIWQIENFKYLQVSNVCKAAKHSNVEGIGKLSIGSDVGHNQTNNSVTVNNNIISYIWPPLLVKIPENQKIASKAYFLFENSSTKEANHNPELINDSQLFLLVKSAYQKNTKSLEIVLFADENINFFELDYLIDSEPIFDDFNYQISKQDIFKYELIINGSNINNYFHLKFNKSGLDIKFPININNRWSSITHLSTILILNSTSEIPNSLEIRDSDLNQNRSCFWHIYELDAEIPCKNRIEFIKWDQNQIKSEQSYIIYPKWSLPEPYQFTRILLSESKNCLHRGVTSHQSKCICRPGYYGPRCELNCHDGYFGANCEFSCPEKNCSGMLICTRDPMGCQCAPGLNPLGGCIDRCESNRWGPDCFFNCSHCESGRCNRISGKCEITCESGGCGDTNNSCNRESKSIKCFDSIYFIEIYSNDESGRLIICFKTSNKGLKTCERDLDLIVKSDCKIQESNRTRLYNDSICDRLKTPSSHRLNAAFNSTHLSFNITNTESNKPDIYLVSQSGGSFLIGNEPIDISKLQINSPDVVNPDITASLRDFSQFFASNSTLVVVILENFDNSTLLVDTYIVNLSQFELTTKNIFFENNFFTFWSITLVIIAVSLVINCLILTPTEDMTFYQDFNF